MKDFEQNELAIVNTPFRGRAAIGSTSRWLGLAVWLTSVGLATVVRAQTDVELFERVFGRRPEEIQQRVSVPFYLENRYQSDVQINLAANREESFLTAMPVLQAVESQLRSEAFDQLKATVDEQGNVTLKQLRDQGLEIELDERKLELRATVPAVLRRAKDSQLYGRVLPRGVEETVAPSAFSAYLNLRSGLDHVQQSANGRNEGLQPFRGDLEGAVNVRDWVVEGTASYTEDAPEEWRRGDVRLVRDDPERRIRYSVGDLAYPVVGFQSFMPLGGFTLARNFSLQPYRVTQPRGRTSFFLQSPSKVEVLVNGRRVQTLQLPAGPHNLTDFLFASGGNDVELQITDDVGRVETIRLSFYFDSRLLAQGEQEFAYSIGLPSRDDGRDRVYEDSFPTVSLFHRAGLSDTLTAGLNFQGNNDQQMMGAEAVWATRLGNFQPDVAFSHVEAPDFGWAARMGYRYFNPNTTWRGSWTFAVQYRDKSFVSLGNLTPNQSVAWDFSARYSQQLPRRMHGGVGGTYQLSRGDRPDTSGVNLFLSKRIGRSANADLTLDRRETAARETEYRAYLSLTFRFGGNRESVRVSHDTLSDISRAEWRHTSANTIGGLDGNLGVQRSPEDYGVFGGLRYRGYRAEAQVAQNITTPSEADEQVDSRTSFRLGTALVYAGGQFAVTRPVRDSFAIVVPHPALKEFPMGVNPVRDYYSARADWLGPAVVPDLTAYQVRTLTIDTPDLPPGYDVGPGRHTVLPTYKSGTVIRVGTGATVLLMGVLETFTGQPVSLLAGEVVAVDDPQGKPLELFTNRNGRFSVEGLKPGRYELRLYADPKAAVRFEIPKDKAGVYEIGVLRLPAGSRLEAALQSNTGG